MKFKAPFRCLMITLLILTTGATVHAQDKKIKLPIKIPPKLLEAEKSYQEKVTTFSQDVQKEFEEYDNYLLKVQKPEIDKILALPAFEYCKDKKLLISEEHAKMITSFRLRRDYLSFKNIKSFKPPKNLLEHIEEDKLIEHAMFRSMERRQAFSQTAAHFLGALEDPKRATEVCEKNKKSLEEDFTEPYFVETNLRQLGFLKMEQENSQSCTIGYRYLTPEKELISLAIAFYQNEGKYYFEMSSKVTTDDNKKAKNIQDAWVHFGNYNTLSKAKKIKPYDSLLVLQLPVNAAPAVLSYIKDKPAFIGTDIETWEKPVVFAALLDKNEVHKMANCVSSIAPKLNEQLTAAGFKSDN